MHARPSPAVFVLALAIVGCRADPDSTDSGMPSTSSSDAGASNGPSASDSPQSTDGDDGSESGDDSVDSADDGTTSVSATESSTDGTTMMGESEGDATYGLEWSGDGDVRSMLYWHDPFPIYDATYIFVVYPRKKTRGDIKYYTTFFWGNDGDFVWDGGNANTYYGAHPYPIPAPGGPGQWEISIYGSDITTGMEVEWDRWYTQAFRAWRESESITHHEFYWDWPDMTRVIEHTIDDPSWANQDPPTPAIVIGQAPNLNGASWGGYPGWEEFNGVIRGIQIYSGLLSLDDIAAEIEAPESSAAGQELLWYLNTDPRPSDVTDKRSAAPPHDPLWDGTPPAEWMGQ